MFFVKKENLSRRNEKIVSVSLRKKGRIFNVTKEKNDIVDMCLVKVEASLKVWLFFPFDFCRFLSKIIFYLVFMFYFILFIISKAKGNNLDFYFSRSFCIENIKFFDL